MTKRISAANVTIFAILFLVIFALCEMLPWSGDDLNFGYMPESGERVRSLWDVAVCQVDRWFSSNGRLSSHFLCYIFSGFKLHFLFALLNGLVYCLLLWLILKLCDIQKGVWRMTLLGAMLILFAANTYYTPSCQIGYIWTSVAALYVITLFLADNKLSVWTVAAGGVVALLAGNGNEAISLPLSGAFVIYALTHLRKLDWAKGIFMVLFWVGTLVIVTSPATQSRADESMTEHIDIAHSIIYFIEYSRALYVFILALAICAISKKLNVKQFYCDNSLYINAWALAILMNVILGVTNNRQIFGCELFCIILTVKLLKQFKIKVYLLAIATIIIAAIYGLKFYTVVAFRDSFKDVYNKVATTDENYVFSEIPKYYRSIVDPTRLTEYGFNSNTTRSILTDYADHATVEREIYVLPYEAQEAIKQGEQNEVCKLSNGAFLLVRDHSNPAVFKVNRSLSLLGIDVRSAGSFDVKDFAEYGGVTIGDVDLCVISNDVAFQNINNIEILQ